MLQCRLVSVQDGHDPHTRSTAVAATAWSGLNTAQCSSGSALLAPLASAIATAFVLPRACSEDSDMSEQGGTTQRAPHSLANVHQTAHMVTSSLTATPDAANMPAMVVQPGHACIVYGDVQCMHTRQGTYLGCCTAVTSLHGKTLLMSICSS